MEFRNSRLGFGVEPVDTAQLGGVGQQAPPQAPGLLQMAQAAMGDGGGPVGDVRGGGGGDGAAPFQSDWSIMAPPAGWQSLGPAYQQAGIPNGWLGQGNYMENPDALARTMRGPQMPYGINPFTDIEYGPGENGTSGFTLRGPDGTRGPDLFGGHQWTNPGSTGLTDNFPRDIPRLLPKEYQAWLAPALMKHFYGAGYTGQGGSGVNAPWTRQYAPTAPVLEHPTWPGIAQYDPWHRDLGAYANLYS